MALGGIEKLRSLRSVCETGEIETGGLTGTYERWTTSRGQLHVTINIPGAVHQETVLEQSGRAWMLDRSGTVHELSGSVLQGVVSSAYEATYSFLLAGRMAGRVDLLQDDSSSAFYVLRLEPNGGLPVTVFLDKTTFLPNREIIHVPAGMRTTKFSDWGQSSGVKWAGTWREGTPDQGSDVVIQIRHLSIDCPVAASLFQKPEERAAPAIFPAGLHQITLRAEVFKNDILIPVRLGDGPTGWFVLDSGASQSAISEKFTEKNGISFRGNMNAEGAGGAASSGIAGDVTFDLSGVQIHMNSVSVMDLSAFGEALGHSVDGLLGYDALSRLVVRIDYDHARVTAYDPAKFVPEARDIAVPITFFGNVPQVPGRIFLEGHSPQKIRCLIDTGAASLTLAAPFVSGNRVLESAGKTAPRSSYGLGGESRELVGQISGFELGHFLLRRPEVVLSSDTRGMLASPDFDALVGGEILSRFIITFDYPRQRILLQAGRRFAAPFE